MAAALLVAIAIPAQADPPPEIDADTKKAIDAYIAKDVAAQVKVKLDELKAGAAAGNAKQGTRIAMVNVVSLFEKSQKVKREVAKAKERFDKKREEIAKAVADARAEWQAAQGFKPGTKPWTDAQRKYGETMVRLEGEAKVIEVETQQQIYVIYSETYAEVRAKLELVAKKLGYHVIVRVADDELKITDAERLQYELNVKTVLYWDKSFCDEVTDRVLAAINMDDDVDRAPSVAADKLAEEVVKIIDKYDEDKDSKISLADWTKRDGSVDVFDSIEIGGVADGFLTAPEILGWWQS
jgi:hypothetical protein